MNHQTSIIKLEILGIGSLRYLSVKQNLLAALQIMQLDIPVNEVKDIDKILEGNLIGIPALRVNNTILFQNEVPSIEDIQQSLNEFLHPE